MDKVMMERIVKEADYIILTKCTIRQAAKKFGISKTTIHTDITHRLKRIDIIRYEKVRKVIENNIRERTLRGGESTRHTKMLNRYSKIA